jgi:membrane protein DedA with SNARE-associated domain
MTEAIGQAGPAGPSGQADRHAKPAVRTSTVLCGAGLGVGVLATYVLIALTPSLLAHHSVLLEALNGSTTAVVTGGALARVGRTSLLVVAAAPLVTILTFDVFYWWAGRLWGSRVAEFYARHNPRAGRWIDRAERLVRRGGIWTLAVGYYLPVPNTLIYLSCGVSEMALGTFLLGDLIGLLLWEALLISLGWAIGRPAVHVVNSIGHYSLLVTVGVIVLLVVIGGLRQRRRVSEPGDTVNG